MSFVANAAICRDILQTAADVVWNLPAMSLADDSKIPPLGASSLQQVSKFLKNVVKQESGADIESMSIFSAIIFVTTIIQIETDCFRWSVGSRNLARISCSKGKFAAHA